jgi:flagella basal body P-ring formation protein FlgA
VYWAIVLSFAAVVAAATHQQLSRLEDARQQWQETRSVLVADTDLKPGNFIKASNADLPVAAVPESALHGIPDGAQLRQRVAVGEVLVEADLTHVPGPAARADPGTVVVGLTDPLSRGVVVGLAVQVAAEGVVLASRATVVETIDDVVFVAVAGREAPAVASAAHSGLATLLYLP